MSEKIIKWYYTGFWMENMVRTAVTKGILTTEEAADILKS